MLILKTWLQYLTDLDFFGLFMKIIRSIFLALDGIIYAIISYCYEVFTFISEIRVFENEDMVNLANRIYILIGVVSLFLVAYTLLNAIINPENATKDKNKSFTGIVKNIILAIIGIAIVPTVFDYAYEFQSRVLCNNVIQKFFLENNITEDDDSRAKMGAQMSLYLFKSFYYIKGSEDDTSLDENANSNWETMAQSIVSDSDDSYNLSMAFTDIELGNRSISEALGDFDDSIDSGKLGYLFLISTLAGAYCAYVLLNFVIDMGVRAVKLAYLQLIAPLPILTIILPNQKKVFDNWLKKTSSCFIEVFTRIIAMSFAFYAIKYLRPWIFNDMSSVSCGRTVGAVTKLLAEAAFIIGVFTFLKQLPKFLKDLLPGFDSSGFKLGIADKLGEMALIGDAAKSGFQRAEGAATGALGGLATGLGNRDKINWKNAVMQGATQGFKGKGNQFSKQRKATFQSIGEYEDKDQGLFGGESKVSKFINDHKKDVKKDYTEYGTDYKNNIEKSKMMDDLKTDANFGEAAHNKRMKDFADSDIMKQAIDYAKHQQEITGVFSEKAQKDAIATFLEKTRTTTQDKDLARSIYQFQKEQAADEVYRAMSKYSQEEKNMSDNEIEDKISEIKTRQKNIPIQKQHLEDAIQTSQSKIDELRKSLAEHKDEIPQSVQDYMNNQINNLNAGIESRRKAISNLENENRQLSVDAERLGTLRDDKNKYVSKINEMAIDVLLGNGSLDVSGKDYITQLNDTEKGMAQEYRGFDAGIKTANKVSTTDDYLKELIDLSKKNNKE